MSDVLFGVEAGQSQDYRPVAKPSTGSDVWLTPPDLLAALGVFDLDPCAAPNPRPWPTARQHYTLPTDGLAEPWEGRGWLNPPYSNVRPWLARLADHGRGPALIFARTDTAAFHEQVWQRATALRFLRGRVTFYRPTATPGRDRAGGATSPSVLVAYGDADADVLRGCSIPGAFVTLGATS